MKKKMPEWLALLIIPLAGSLVLALVFASYYGVFLLADQVFKLNPDMHMDQLRFTSMEILVLIYALFFVLVKGHELLKATLLCGPTVMLMVTLMFRNTESTLYMILILIFVPLLLAGLFKWMKKPWFYYYALVFSIIMTVWYGWPQA